MEKIIISQNENQSIKINSNKLQQIKINNLKIQNIGINNKKEQDVNIKQNENQLILVGENGKYTSISDVLVNGVSVVSGDIAYVIVPTKLSELQNDENFISSESDPTVPTYVKNISLSNINEWNNKQNELVSGVNIKTINSNSLLGSGNLNISTSYTAGEGISINSENVISNDITSYNDLSDLPDIPTKLSDLTNDEDFVSSDELSEVAFNGSYNALSDTPEIPTDTSDLINDSGFIDKDVNDLTYYTLSSNLSSVATSGDYDDLLNKPSIPTNTSDLDNDSGFISETDYASELHGGTIKTGVNSYDINASGYLYAETETYSDYGSIANTSFISKGTLENVLTGKGFITNNYQIYSTTETRVGTWIDNRPIYRTVIEFNPSTSSLQTQVNHNISDIREVIPTSLCILRRTSGQFVPLSMCYPDTSSNMVAWSGGWQVSKTKIETWIGSNMRGQIDSSTLGYGAVAIIEYTKTTD